ncbi:MAG: hypothetical protein P8X53_14835 [Chromatiales bacterium]
MRLIVDKDGWKRSLLRAGGYDFYHTYDYHQLAATPESRPVLCSTHRSSSGGGFAITIDATSGNCAKPA